MQDESEAESMLFSYITHPTCKGDAALLVDTKHVIQVHPSCSLERLIAVFPELTIDERFALSGVIHQTNSFAFGLILPNTVTVRDEAYMVSEGWIELDE